MIATYVGWYETARCDACQGTGCAQETNLKLCVASTIPCPKCGGTRVIKKY